MCSVVIHYRPGHDWPLLLAANRDEMMDRPWLAPGRHWPDQPHILAGKDQVAGGSWLGMNDWGVVAVVLNRFGTLGRQPGKSSRGLLVLQALHHDCDCARAAVGVIESWLTAHDLRPFNLIIADAREAFWIAWRGTKPLATTPIPPGLHMLTAHDLDDVTDPRIQGHLPRFQTCPAPRPESSDWSCWNEILGSSTPVPGSGPESAMCIQLDSGFATVSSALIALPDPDHPTRIPQWLFAAGKPDQVQYRPVIRSAPGHPEQYASPGLPPEWGEG
ncbi:MAG: NRDE family protein [Magnetococcales bacterium]|nr:NRDE family protein [Magnetococcales bacterium]MBF0346335.1 NRDE family protein [Magnetococcales bacterium]MBF0631638.1 NRDE family protein [Magnetococcales bacterium]